MNIGPKLKWLYRIEVALLVVFALVIAINIWAGIENIKLNKRHEQSIEQLESFVQELNRKE